MVNATLHHDACLTSNQCLNGGTCFEADGDTSDFRHCHCPEGFGGFRCENYCPLECQNYGVCQQVGSSNSIDHYIHNTKTNKNSYVCKCKGSFTGLLCQTPFVNCGGHQCLNGATCPDSRAEFFVTKDWCKCADGYDGDLCQYRLAVDKSMRRKAGISGAVSGLFVCIAAAVVVAYWRRRRRKRLDPRLSMEERQNLHLSIPREERDDWECRNII
jgi:hypothetical protein